MRRVGFDHEVEKAWTAFRQRLADWVAAAEPDAVLVVEMLTGIEADELAGAEPYVQLCQWGEGMVRAEVASNVYLDERFELDPGQEADLDEAGWWAPEVDEDGDPVPGYENFHLDVEQREADRVAVLAVGALRDVFGCAHPALLSADGLEPQAAEEPHREPSDAVITKPGDAKELQSLVDRTLAVMLGSAPAHDEDGDVPIRCGQSVVFVRVLQDAPAVEVFSDLVVGVDLAKAEAVVGRLNRDAIYFQYAVDGDRLRVRAWQLAYPFVPDQLRALVARLCDTVDDDAATLVDEVGGRRFLDPVPTVPPPVRMPPGLATLDELLHTGDVHPATVARLFDERRSPIVKAIVLLRQERLELPDHDLDRVLQHLRAALRLVADREAGIEPPRKPGASRQLSLIPDEDLGTPTLEMGWP